jgi:ubiquinone biosynthesis monooxygenase Coq7
MAERHLSFFDRAITHFDQALRTLTPGATHSSQPSPATGAADADLNAAERRHVAGLMRIDHTGEVCAQALYQGQALTARRDSVRAAMAQAAREETDHLAWCEQRLRELDSHTSYLNPVFYGLSLAIGAAAGAAGDRYSLGFVAATEEQVCEHLRDHLRQLPPEDGQSRALLSRMLEDEGRHATAALEAGGARFPRWFKRAMLRASRVMTATTYRL